MRLHAGKLLAADVIITTHFDEALAVQAVLHEQGKKIPEDVAVIGFSDSALTEAGGLTTWRMPWSVIGREAVTRMEVLCGPRQHRRRSF